MRLARRADGRSQRPGVAMREGDDLIDQADEMLFERRKICMAHECIH